MKERDKTPEERLRKVEINNSPDNEFKIRIIKKLNKLGRKVDESSILAWRIPWTEKPGGL